MNIEVIQTSPLERDVQVQVDADAVNSECIKAYNQLKKRVRVKGFRPGKVPQRELKRRYGGSVRKDVVKTLIRTQISESLKHEDLQSVLFVSPAEVVDDSGDGGFTFRFTAEVKPEVAPTGYLGLELNVASADVDDADVEAEIEQLRQSHAVVEPIEDRKTVEAEDWVEVNYKPTSDNEALQVLAQSEQLLRLTNEMTSERFGGLVGGEVGTTVTLTVPFDGLSNAVDGVDDDNVEMAIEVLGLKRSVLPEVDAEFAEIAGDVDTVEELRAQIVERLTKTKADEHKKQVKETLEERLLSRHEFDVPKAFVKSRAEEELNNRLQTFRRSGISPEQVGLSIDAMREDARTDIERRIRVEFVLGAIADREKLTVGQKEFDEGLDRIARSAGSAAQQVRRLYRDPANRAAFTERLRIDKTLDFLISKATISSAEGG